MKLEIGIPDYPYDHAIKDAVLRGRLPNKPVPLLQVSMIEMEAMHERLPNVRATPAYIAYDVLLKRVWLHPLPSGEFHLDIIPGEVVEVMAPEPVPEPAREVAPEAPPEMPQTGRFTGKITKAVAEAFGKKLP